MSDYMLPVLLPELQRGGAAAGSAGPATPGTQAGTFAAASGDPVIVVLALLLAVAAVAATLWWLRSLDLETKAARAA